MANEIDFDLLRYLIKEGYSCILPVHNRGFCAVISCVFGEVDLVYGLTWQGVTGRYGYGSMTEAVAALCEWDGSGDPPGKWVVHKGQGFKIKNPLYDKDL